MTNASCCVVISPCLTLEVVPESVQPWDVLGQGYIYEHHVSASLKLYWSNSGYLSSNVNPVGRVVGQVVKGDVFVRSSSLDDLNEVLAERVTGPQTSKAQSPLTGALNDLKFTSTTVASDLGRRVVGTELSTSPPLAKLNSILQSRNAATVSPKAMESTQLFHHLAPAHDNDTKCQPQLGPADSTVANDTGIAVEALPSTGQSGLYSSTGHGEQTSVWEAFTCDVLCTVAQHLPPTASQVLTLQGVNRTWRSAVQSDQRLVQRTQFVLDPLAPFKAADMTPDSTPPLAPPQPGCRAATHPHGAASFRSTTSGSVSRSGAPTTAMSHQPACGTSGTSGSSGSNGRNSQGGSMHVARAPSSACNMRPPRPLTLARRYLLDDSLLGSPRRKTSLDLLQSPRSASHTHAPSSPAHHDGDMLGRGAGWAEAGGNACTTRDGVGGSGNSTSDSSGSSNGAGGSSGGSSSRGTRASVRRPAMSDVKYLPALLWEAARLGNLSALIVMAQLHEVVGAHDQAVRWWRRAAKAGDVEGMFKSGMAYYQGSHGCVVDVEGAHMWLSRVVKNILKVDSLSEIALDGSGSASGSGAGSGSASAESSSLGAGPGSASTVAAGSGTAASAAATAGGGAGPSLPPSQSRLPPALIGQVRCLDPGIKFMLRRAALVLAYMAFDGEVVTSGGSAAMGGAYWTGFGEGASNRTEAVRLFRLAAGCGCPEAEQALGWIFNTGQYG